MNDCIWCTERQGKFLKEGFRQVHTGPGNPGKSWNFILTFSRTFKLKKKEEKDYRSWKVLEICFTIAIKFSEFTLQEMYVDGKEY